MKCKQCEKDKPLDEFYKSENKNGRESTCKECRNVLKYEQRRNNRIKKGLPIRTAKLKVRKLLKENKKLCPKCKKIKELDEFPKNPKMVTGVGCHCSECSREMINGLYNTEEGKKKAKARYNRIRQRNNRLKQKYGITYDEYKEILNEQNGRCAICGRNEEENGKELAVDHDHVTMKNRDLLCSSCNLVIGFFEKNNMDADKIKNYLNKHKTNTNGIPSHRQPL